MPSSRSQSSSPATRSAYAPYDTPTSTATRPGHMRRAGSDTHTRRVLADIDWYTVVDGQHLPPAQPTADGEPVDGETAQAAVESDIDPTANLRLEMSGLEAANLGAPFGTEPISPLMNQFAALSLAPRTPSRRTASGSSTSSVESSPEQLPMDLGYLNLESVGFTHDSSPFSRAIRPGALHRGVRSFSCTGYEHLSRFEDAIAPALGPPPMERVPEVSDVMTFALPAIALH